ISEVELGEKLSHVPAAGRIALGPSIHAHAVELGANDRAAEDVCRFEKRDLHTDLRAFARGDESADAAAHHDDMAFCCALSESCGAVLAHECASSTMRVSWSGSVSGGTP